LPAFGQDFTIQASAMNPPSVDPGIPSTATISLSTLNSTSAVDVALTCAVTAGPTGTNAAPPTCKFSSTPVSTPGSSTITVNSTAATLPGSYTITITGTGPTTTHQTTVIFNVVAVIPQYSLSVTNAISPTSVHAGNGATATISIIPAGGYTGSVMLACSAVTPAVTLSPVCTFSTNNVPETAPGIPVQTTAPVPVTLTINTTGPIVTTTEVFHPETLYKFGAPLMGLTLLAGTGMRRKARRKLFGFTLLLLIASLLLLLPACGNTNKGPTTIQNPAGNTPNNNYTFMLSGTDSATGQAPSNATEVSVTLTVN